MATKRGTATDDDGRRPPSALPPAALRSGGPRSSAAAPRPRPRLVEGLRERHDWAFEELVRCYRGRLLAVVRRYLADEQDALDAVQDAFLSAFQAIDRFEEGCQLSTWLHRIAINAALMILRRQRRRPQHALDEAALQHLGALRQPLRPAGADGQPELTLERREVAAFVRDCIRRLPASYRAVISLRDLEGLDTSEAARRLGVSANAVKIRSFRARRALRGIVAARRQDLGRAASAPWR